MAIITATPRLDIMLLILEENPDLAINFIAQKVFPVVPVSLSTGPIPKILARRIIERVKKSRYGRFAQVSSEVVTGATYNCVEEGIDEPYDAKDIEVLGGEDRAMSATGSRAMQTLLLVWEYQLSSFLFSTSTFGSGYNTAAAAAWDNASGKPLDDVANAKHQVHKRIGHEANTLVLGFGGKLALDVNPQVQSQVRNVMGYTSMEGIQHQITEQALQNVFGLENIFIGRSTYNSADEGQTEVLVPTWSDDYALVCYVPPQSDLNSMTDGLGMTPVWEDGLEGVNAEDLQQMRDSGFPGVVLGEYGEPGQTHGYMQARGNQDQLMLNKPAGHLITGI